MKKKNIVFVCTGNTCRSPMAEGFAKKLYTSDDNPIVFKSRGIYVRTGDCVAKNSIVSMQEYAIDISDIIPTNLTEDDIKTADLILTMTREHKRVIMSLDKGVTHRVFTLCEYAFPNSDEVDISDPFALDITAYKICASEIERCIAACVDKF